MGKNLHHVILIHGFTGNKKNLYFLAKYLEENHFNQIHFFEYPILQTVEKSVNDLHEMVKDSPRSVHLIGHSLGGAIARRYASKNSKRVKSLITLGAPHFYDWHEKEIAVFGSDDPLVLKPRSRDEKKFVVVGGVGHLALITNPIVLGLISAALGARDQNS